MKRGLSLLELLVGMAVAIICGAVISNAFIGLNRSFYVQEGIRVGQANLRQALLQVHKPLRMAGYGIDPEFTFAVPGGWNSDPARNLSDRLVFHSRDPAFATRVVQNGATANSLALSTPLTRTLSQGQIIQVMCAGAVDWTYARLRADALAGTATLNLDADTAVFPNLPAELGTQPCYQGDAAETSWVFKVDRYDFRVELVDDDGRTATPPTPYLFRNHGLRGSALGEPVAENVEAFRIAYLRKTNTGRVVTFVPNPLAAKPNIDTEPDDASRFTDHPANIVAVRVGILTRAGVRDEVLRDRNLDKMIPAFGWPARPVLTGPPGFRRVFYEASVPIRNMRLTEMMTPPWTSDPDATNPASPVCKGARPNDGMNCPSTG